MDEIQLLTEILSELQNKDILIQLVSNTTDILLVLKFIMSIQIINFFYNVVMKERRYGSL